MAREEICQGCNQRHECREIYERLGSAKGPSVALRAVFAFLLPMLVFIGVLGISDIVLSGFEITAGSRAFYSILVSLPATIVCVFVTRSRKALNRSGG